MKLEFSIAAEGALVVRVPQPIRATSPTPSSAVTASTPVRDQGSCAPTRPQAIPSRMRCLARSRTTAGTSSSVVLASQHERRPVGPAGSVGWPALSGATSAPCDAGLPSRIDVIGVVIDLLFLPWLDLCGRAGWLSRVRLNAIGFAVVVRSDLAPVDRRTS